MITAAMHAGHDPREVRAWSLRDLQRFCDTMLTTEEDLTDG